jgi:hypothetical protein
MSGDDLDTSMRSSAFGHLRRLGETHDDPSAAHFKAGFQFQNARIPLVTPQRRIFKPQLMRFLNRARHI